MRPYRLMFLVSAVLLAGALFAGCAKDNPAAPPAPPELKMDAGCLALWHMDEGTGQSVVNAAGPARNLVLGPDTTAGAADPAWSPPGFNGVGAALAFDDAQEQYARADDGFPFPSNQLTVEFLVKTSASNMTFVFGTNNISVYIWITPTGHVQFDIGDGTDWGISATSSVAVADDAWHYVACTYDQVASRVYVDGVLRATVAQVVDVADAGYVTLGGRPSSTFLRGLMDEVRISMVARTATEIVNFQQSR